jgi:DNA-binding MarR family transcriptional regulator
VFPTIKQMADRNFYLRFIGLVNAFQKNAGIDAIDPTALRLLEVITQSHAAGNPLKVTDAMALGEIASPATMHRKIEALKTQGYIATEFQGDNRRAQYLVPSAQGLGYLDTLGQALLQAAK